MTPDFNEWVGSDFPLSDWLEDIDRAYETAQHIDETGVSITVTRAGVAQAAQTVRLEPLTNDREVAGISGITVSQSGLLVTGYRDHPDETDTSLQRGDRFYYGGQLYDILYVVPNTRSRLLAVADVSGEHRTD